MKKNTRGQATIYKKNYAETKKSQKTDRQYKRNGTNNEGQNTTSKMGVIRIRI
jgi:hypothetical protein